MFKFSFRQQVLTGFAFAVVLVFIVAILSYRSIDQLEADQAQANHTQQVIRSTRNILQLLIDAETGARGYFAAGQRVFLDPYNASLQNINAELSTLRNLTQDNEGDVLYSDSLINLTEIKLRVMKENIDTRDSKGLDYIISNNLMLNGKIAMDNIRSLIKRIETRQNKLLNERKLSTQQAARYTVIVIVVGSLIFLIIIIFLFSYIQKSFAVQKRIEKEITETNNSLEKVLAENENKNWLLTGGSLLSERIQGEQSEKELTNNILTKMCRYTGALTGTLYLFNEDEDFLDLYAYYAFHDVSQLKQRINKSEGWVGQVARDQRSASIKGKLNDKLQLQTSVVSQELAEIIIVPFFFDKKLKGVMELGYQTELKQIQREFIDSSTPTIGVAVNTAQARTIMRDLFEETQQQAEELEAQQEEMRVTNEELLSKTEMLQASEEELRVQQEELRTINAELEEKASLLEEKNQAIEEARAAISVKANELETTGKYKSEFLANMSHELRTPLNSILVLARILKDNKTANLSDDQIKYASVIFNAGNDLLTLINDILDLSKIESGKMDIQNEDVQVADILKDMEMLFNEVALNKKISFTNSISNVSDSIYTDKTRVEQVIKNLLSNAFKFTPENGKISVDVTAGSQPNTISFHVKDSGIGIPEAKQKIIFEAFQQADGSTSRKYGGTGLGLSISRELTALLGGYITLESTPGVGSKFTLTLPVRASQTQPHEEEVPTVEDFNTSSNFLKPAAALTRPVDKNREPLVVIVEDDKNFADILRDYAQEHGYKSVMINDGLSAVQAVKDNQPDAVILDIMLPGKDGWQILKELKKDEATMHIPVHLMSAGEAAANRVRKEGAISFMKKPINTETLDKLFGDVMKQSGIEFKQILLVEDHEAQSQALKELMQKQGIAVDQAYTAEEAFNKLNANEYQCVILDLNLPDMSGLDLLDKIKGVDRFAELPVIINTAMELDKNAVSRLMQYANAMVMKTNKSADRLIDEVNLFLHKISSTPAPKPTAPGVQSSPVAKPVIGVSNRKDLLKGKKVLIVDDDMRNIFALSSALQSYDIKVEIANDGEEALTKLEELPDVDMVLMDIMMPKMDGYEATRAIRKHSKWTRLPVIALTAKAMKDDREKCIAAGANDYITKPVDMDRLISLMQLWLGN